MVWSTANYNSSCYDYSCNQLGLLAFLSCLTQHSNKSFNNINHHEESEFYDFIVVGAGSAGCVVANRLSENPKWKVLLLEAGDEEPVAADVPAMWTELISSDLDYGYKVSLDPMQNSSKDQQDLSYARGKVMGGSSSINGMFYMRGSEEDYNSWARSGCTGWSWNEVLPYFKKSEDFNLNTFEISKNHGRGGYLTVEPPPEVDDYHTIFKDAYKEIGLSEIDYNGGDQLGVGKAQYTTIHGSRQSSNGAFIRPIRSKRRNLTIKTKASVTKIIINPKTKEAYGVEYEVESPWGRITKKAYASKEVIISAGVVESPKLLMLSGIGPTEYLKRLNIKVIKDLPVGRNFDDHVYIASEVFEVKNSSMSTTCETVQNDLTYWLKNHGGPWSNPNGVGVIAFYQTKYEKKHGEADLQLFVTWNQPFNLPAPYSDSFVIHMFLLSPKIEGWVRLNETDPVRGKPEIHLNSLLDDQDVKIFIEGMKFARKLGRSKVLKDNGINYSKKLKAGCESFDFESDAYSECVIKKYMGIGLHGVGTCKMGTSKDAVVNPELKVYGIKRLRVIDASIMPKVVRGNTNAPAIMIGEKGSDMIKRDWL